MAARWICVVILFLVSPLSELVAAEPFELELGYTRTGWSPGSTAPALNWNSGFLLVDAGWKSEFKDKDDVRYEAWIQSATTDWGSANMLKAEVDGAGVWRQKLHLSPVNDGARKKVRFKMTFDYRPPGLSSCLINRAAGKPHYDALPSTRPLAPGKYTFTCVVTRVVSNAPPEVARKDFEITITGQKDPVFLSGIENHRVYQRKNKTKGDISFYLGCDSAGQKNVSVVIKKAGANVAAKQFSAQPDQRLTLPDVPVGGDYTIEIRCDAMTKSFTNIWVGDIWIVSGQSNAVGTGHDASLGRKPMPGVNGVSPKYGVLEWGTAQDGFFEQTVGPWVTAAQDFYQDTRVPVGLIGHAVGSKSMDYFMDASRQEMPYLKPLVDRYGQKAARFFWYQGESDAFSKERWESYEPKLKAMAAAMRRDTKNTDLVIGIVQLAKYLWFKDDHFAPVREAQRQFVVKDPKAVLYSTMPCEVNDKDKIHLVTKSYVELGQQIAKHMIELENTGTLASPGPMVESIRFSSADRKEVVAKFTNGEGLTASDTADQWFVTDAQRGGFGKGGFLPIQSVKIEPNAGQVVVTLTEPAGEGAALSYGYRSDAGGTLQNGKGFPAPAFVKVKIQ